MVLPSVPVSDTVKQQGTIRYNNMKLLICLQVKKQAQA